MIRVITRVGETQISDRVLLRKEYDTDELPAAFRKSMIEIAKQEIGPKDWAQISGPLDIVNNPSFGQLGFLARGSTGREIATVWFQGDTPYMKDVLRHAGGREYPAKQPSPGPASRQDKDKLLAMYRASQVELSKAKRLLKIIQAHMVIEHDYEMPRWWNNSDIVQTKWKELFPDD